MSIAHLLEDFSPAAAEPAGQLMTEEALEELRLAAFENGYRAGWDDATAAGGSARDRSQVEDALARNLEDLSFTYHEARGQMVGNLRPLFACLVEKVLPKLMADTVAPQIVERLQDLAAGALDAPAELVLAPGGAELVAPHLTSETAIPVSLHEDPALQPGQALIRVGEQEREFDAARLIDEIEELMAAHLYQAKETAHHG